MDGWYYSQNGQSVGPVSLTDLKGLLATGQLDANESVWHQSMAGWTEASQVPALKVSRPAPAPAVTQFAAPPIAVETAYEAQAEPIYQSQQLGYQGSGGVGEIIVTTRALSLLQQTRPWVMLMAVLFFLGAAGLALGGVAMLVGGSFMNSQGGQGMGSDAILSVLAIVYFIIAFVYFLLGFYLVRYFGNIGSLTRSRRSEALEQAMHAQLQFWRTTGIAVIVLVVLYLVMIGWVVAARV